MAHLMRWYVVLATMLLAATMPSAAAKDDRLRIGIKGDIARRFHLRRDVRYHDGAPFTAGDVLFTFERARGARSQMRSRIPDGARFIAVDAHTVDVHLEKPNPILHANWESLLIMSRPWAERHGLADPGAVPQPAPRIPANGTGPYRVISHRAGQVTRFERHRRWWGEARGLARRVDLFTLTNAQTRTAALLSGQIPCRRRSRISRGSRQPTGSRRLPARN
jgi:peptide/nickel transport system substrate-binding protein